VSVIHIISLVSNERGERVDYIVECANY
jgi:hypothetical protein